MKRSQREDVVQRIQTALCWQPHVNVYLFDDFLPAVDGNTDKLFVEELLQQFGGGRVRIWAPNLKTEVVDAQRWIQTPVGFLTAGVGCWHEFNARWAEEIRCAGGLDVVFADCFRGFERGCGALVADLVERRLLRRRVDARDQRHCALTFAVSDRYDRAKGWNVTTSVVQIIMDLTGLFAGDGDCPYSGRVVSQCSYGATMHYFTAVVHEREWTPQLPGFETRVQHCDEPM